MDWLGELKPVFGGAAAIVIGLLISALIYQTRKLNASEEAHHKTRSDHATALGAINEKVTAALLANATNGAQFTELLRGIAAVLNSLKVAR
jgi:hypothetical protein